MAYDVNSLEVLQAYNGIFSDTASEAIGDMMRT